MITLRTYQYADGRQQGQPECDIYEHRFDIGQSQRSDRRGKNNVREIVQNLNELSKTLSSKSGQIDRIVTNVENFKRFAEQVEDSDDDRASYHDARIAEHDARKSQPRRRHGRSVPERLRRCMIELVDATANLSALLEDLSAPSRYINVSVFGRRNRDE